ncbi:D-(-)-3-hydroxybutyrate oligomer hydrolase [Lysobacter sp. CFH 32150]|uniref:D-(-)-3-hydroxybutyrate oligomer hydrolase n=1 Tax=Lysobacter sp. CFH 32150 TaxID=2927128 RepID=UPI001FA8009F|nr:D-(-)-3-hydroxybutyrate oligomer hydrolase [Lysobacter sp. CFH 32150]MCI4567176.1 D-(-)-3-hydroxybutyrate oligomer hydrolase [Lysobacter sp. CFH 32150]
MMTASFPLRGSILAGVALLAACVAAVPRPASSEASMFTTMRVSEHRGTDDLLTGGLGLDGLRAMTPPVLANPERPSPAELRRRALWNNWRGIADLAPGGGYGDLYGSVANVPGREFHAYATVPGATQPHRVMLQLPDAFDQGKRCVVVTAVSGSRGIYGSIAVAGAWGLPKGCAVAYTDKGAGTDYFDLDARQGVRTDGTVGAVDDGLAFTPEPMAGNGIAFKHAHSRDNPEAVWGRHVRQAAEFALQALNEALPQAPRFTFDNTRVIAVGISNGGGAVLRAAELEGSGAEDGWLDAVVAGEPNIVVADARPLYDYTTEAALLMPCALPQLGLPPMPYAAQRCAALAEAGLIAGADPVAQQKSAYDALRASGWTDAALRAGSISVAFDLWRAVAVTYASTYGRYGVGEHPCKQNFAAMTPALAPRPATAAERSAWWADASGIPPGAGVGITDGIIATTPDPTLPGLRCLRALWDGQGADADRVRQGIAETRAALPREGLPVVVIHGLDDGLVPAAFNSAPYVAKAKAADRDVRYWQVRNAQHFDAFLGFPQYGAQYLPLLPYIYAALDRVWAHLEDGSALPADAVIETTPRGAGKPLDASHLAIPL